MTDAIWPDRLLVDAGDLTQFLFGAADLHVDAGRDLQHDVVAVADRKRQLSLPFIDALKPTPWISRSWL